MNYKKISEFLKALSHPTRLVIVAELLKNKAGKNNKCVNDIKEILKVSQPNISQHLSILKANDIVGWSQQGRKKCYFLRNRRLIKKMIKIFEK